jgi:heptosyltransferase-2
MDHEGLIVAVAPGASHPRRRWPGEHFGQLVAWLQKDVAAEVILIGGPADMAVARSIESLAPAPLLNAVGKTTLGAATALIRRANLFIGNDSGPLHMAASAGVPAVAISCHPVSGLRSHAQSPIRFGPWCVASVVLQPSAAIPPCGDTCIAAQAHCIRQVTLGDVRQAVFDLLQQERTSAEYADGAARRRGSR